MVRIIPALVVGLLTAVAMSFHADATESMKTIAITASEFKFTPARLTLKRGVRVALQITNRGTMDHEFLSTIFKAARDVEVKVQGVTVEADEIEELEFEKGQTATIELTPSRDGTFSFWCAEVLKGKLHRDLGMRGVIQVTP